MSKLYLGIDVGSVSANTVILNDQGKVLEEHYTRIKGQPLKTVQKILEEILTRIPPERFHSISFTGTGGKLLSEILEGHFVNEIIAQAKAVQHFYPEIRTIIDIGGEDSKLIFVEEENGHYKISDFSMNTLCAAGTGSFLDQQASRLGFTIEEFGEIALKSENPPRIAGRCSVFAKSDMIHLQQIATPDYDIVAGLCYALARNFKSNIGKGKTFLKPVSFQGGVAANVGMRKAFQDVLELSDGDLIIPKHFASMGAIGAVLVTQESKHPKKTGTLNLTAVKEYLLHHQEKEVPLQPLCLSSNHLSPSPLPSPIEGEGGKSDSPIKGEGEVRGSPLRGEGEVRGSPMQGEGVGNAYPIKGEWAVSDSTSGGEVEKSEKIEAYLGLDVGSISTNLVVIDKNKRVLSKRYLMTAGRPIEAVRTGLQEIGAEIGDRVEIKGVGTTGSGRYLTADFVGADLVRNEITAQATAAVYIDPAVDTIFEIGGQDSKYISIDNRVVVDFEMNKVCAAGTGSFLEEQAEKLDISIKEEFGKLALSAGEPVRMGERCTVFIESDLVHHQQRGAPKDNLVAGLSYSIVQNYLNRVVGDRRIGDRIFFQGGTAFNKGVVAAFEKVLGKEIIVPENHDVTGAIGVAILSMEERTWDHSGFKGFDLSQRRYEQTSFECKSCPNLCLIRKVSVEGEKPLFYGSRCEKYDVIKRTKGTNLPDLFEEREKMLFASYEREEDLPADAPEIGIPRILYLHEMMPFWKAFFAELGYRVVLSDPTNKELIRKGVENVVAETCFPIKVSHGHALNLLEKGVKRIFLPSIVNLKSPHPEIPISTACPYAQAFPYAVHSSIDFKKDDVQVLQPIFHFRFGRDHLEKELVEFGKTLRRGSKQVKRALGKAERFQAKFYQSLLNRGKEILNQIDPDEKAMVIIGRPYNSCDPGVNLEMPKKLKDLGVLAIPMDFLPLDSVKPTKEIQEMYWRYGQKILSAGKIINEDPRLYAVYITNFGCGPDSFINHFYRDLSKGKPHLQLEIDEHSADAGAITRCEAFLDSLKNAKKTKPNGLEKEKPTTDRTKKIYIPYMYDAAYAVAAAFHACGVEAEVIPESNEETLYWGRKLTSGKECYPCILTTGDMVKTVKDPNFDHEKAAFFMPSGNGPCRFGQYHRFHRLVLDDLGFHHVPIYAPNQDETLYNDLGIMGSQFSRLAWQGIVAVDLLMKKLLETRPYEKEKGRGNQIYAESLNRVCEAIRTGNDLREVLHRSLESFAKVEVESPGTKPLIGIVGEIYVRLNRFSNEEVVRKIEQFGGEAWMAPMTEWVLYVNTISKKRSLQKKSFSNLLKVFLTDYYQKKDEHHLEKVFKHHLRNFGEPKTRAIFKRAKPYIDSSFEGEAILSIGKSIDFAKRGASGIINIMPFTCMPGTIVSALLKRYQEEHNNIPILNMAYDGQEQTNTLTRLEAFMHQAREFQIRKSKKI
ncbi:MAG: CoA activase [Deltaproteobacteria bacterium]|nr:CoA activase [Deltaproteobacteria bacterium]